MATSVPYARWSVMSHDQGVARHTALEQRVAFATRVASVSWAGGVVHADEVNGVRDALVVSSRIDRSSTRVCRPITAQSSWGDRPRRSNPAGVSSRRAVRQQLNESGATVRLSPALSWAPLSRSNGARTASRSATGMPVLGPPPATELVATTPALMVTGLSAGPNRQALLTMLPMTRCNISGRYATPADHSARRTPRLVLGINVVDHVVNAASSITDSG